MRTLANRFIPKDSVANEYKSVNAVIYTYEIGEKYFACAYSGKRTRHDFYYSFRTPEALNAHIVKYIGNLQYHANLKKVRAEKAKIPHNLVVGDIMTYSWGYDQTNISCYQVVAVTPKTVKLHPIQGSLRHEGFMAGYVTPIKDSFIKGAEVFTKKVDAKGYGSMPHGCLGKWDGKELYCSWYA